jgi:hypothetical protein
MTAAPMTAVAVGTTSGWLAVNTASVLRLRDYATTRLRNYTSGASSGTSTDSECTQEWRCPDVGSDGSRSIRIARVEGVRGVRCECGPDRKSRAPHLIKRGKPRSIARLCDEVMFFVAHIRDEARKAIDLRFCLSAMHNVETPIELIASMSPRAAWAAWVARTRRWGNAAGPFTGRPVPRQQHRLTHLEDPAGRRRTGHIENHDRRGKALGVNDAGPEPRRAIRAQGPAPFRSFCRLTAPARLCRLLNSVK